MRLMCTFVPLCFLLSTVFRTITFEYIHSEVQWNAVIYIQIRMLSVCFSAVDGSVRLYIVTKNKQGNNRTKI